MISLAEQQLGAQVGGSLQSNFYWAPMSEMKERNGAREVFPHIVTDRAKPGIIAVTERGLRFVNEANSYHRFVEAMRAWYAYGKPLGKWTIPYLLRHTAYHALDHAWEMQDRDLTGTG